MASPKARSSRTRYQTPLPFDVTTLEAGLSKRRPSSVGSASNSRGSFDSPSRNNEMPTNIYYITRQDSGYDSNSSLAVVETDAWLPYQRPCRKASRDDTRTQARSLSRQRLNRRRSSSDTRKHEPLPRNSSHHTREITKDSRNGTFADMSDARSQAVSRKCSTDTVISWRDPLAQTNSASPAISSGQPRPSFDREPLLVPHKSPSTPKYPEHASADTVDGSIGTEDSESTSDIYCPPRTGMRTMRPRSRSNSSRVGRGPRSVQLETVNGVRLDTMPTNPRASQIGLCIPEIEARDIRQIEDDQFVDDEYLPLDAASRQQCASSPPPIGARQDFVRNISPRPPTVGRDHIFVDNYSRAVVQSHGLDALIEQPDEHSRERPRVPAQAPDRWSSDETQVDSSDGTAAPSPSIARTRVSDLRDVEMTSKTKQVRDLLKGMLKGCVVDRNKPTVSKARKESIDNQHRPASKGSVADRESFEEMIQRTIIQGERQRANAQISTHG